MHPKAATRKATRAAAIPAGMDTADMPPPPISEQVDDIARSLRLAKAAADRVLEHLNGPLPVGHGRQEDKAPPLRVRLADAAFDANNLAAALREIAEAHGVPVGDTAD